MSLEELKENFRRGTISKADYIREMHKTHKILFDYSRFMKNTDISEIKILDDKIIMTTRENGIKMISDVNDERIIPIEILNFNFYENEEFKMLLRLIGENDIIFDIGANIGWYSINIAKLRPKCKIYAFEPIPKTYALLIENIALNESKNISTFNFGFSNENTFITFYYNPKLSGNSSIQNLSHSDCIEEIKATVKKIDDYVRESKISIDFIKCDVEGAELFVFKGGADTIKRDKPIVFTEMLRKWCKPFNYHPNDIIKMFNSMNYKCFSIKGSFLKEFNTMTEETVETNFIFLHTVKHKKIIENFVLKSN